MIDVLVLIFSALAALGAMLSVYLFWWSTDKTSAGISVNTHGDGVTIEFYNTGAKPLHMPTVVVTSKDMTPRIGSRDLRILRAEDEPIKVLIPTQTDEQYAVLFATMEWTEFGRRTPKLRGLTYHPKSHGMLRKNWRGMWVPLSKRQIRKTRGQYSQM